MASDLQQLLFLIDTAYDKQSWHGTNLRGSIRGVTARQAAWRPAPGRHNIAEEVVHAAYWKYTVLRRFTGIDRGSFALKGSNWFARKGELTDAQWREDVSLLNRSHRELRAAITALSPRSLSRTPAGSKVSNLTMLTGIAAHDFYHAGQIQLLKRLQQSR